MIYWNRLGEKISLEPLPYPSFIYEYYHFFLLASVFGVLLIAYFLSLFTNKGEVVNLIKREIPLGKPLKRSHLAFLILPALIYLLYLFMALFDFVPQVDWLILLITYPLTIGTLFIIPLVAERKSSSGKEFSQTSLRMKLIQINLLIIIAWGFWFLPLFLTVKLNHTYVLLLLSLSISTISFSLNKTRVLMQTHTIDRNL